jgi:hypothetical protein
MNEKISEKKIGPGVHIYTLSCLVHAPAGSWERKLQQIEQGRDKAYLYYQPVREAAVAYCATEGEDRDSIVSQMMAQARRQPRGRGQDPESDNLGAFEIFESSCYPKIGAFVGSLLWRPQVPGVPFEGVMLSARRTFKRSTKMGRCGLCSCRHRDGLRRN